MLSLIENQRKNSLSKIAVAVAGMAKMEYLIAGFDRYKAFFHNIKTINENEFQNIVTELKNSKYKF